MRSFEVFAAMAPEQAEAFFRRVKEKAPAYFGQSLHAACAALKTRPAYLLKQAFPKQVNAVRRVLARAASNAAADEALALYFLEVRKELLVEWLDTADIEHDEGALQEDAPDQPAEDHLRKSVEAFRSKDDDSDRELLLRAFAAQESIDWPCLDEMLKEKLAAS
jgi:hypothetical protein